MTTDALLDRIKSGSPPKHPERTSVKGVHDEQLWVILANLGLLADLDAGLLRCYVSDVPLTRENVAGLIKTTSGPKLVSASGLVGFSHQAGR